VRVCVRFRKSFGEAIYVHDHDEITLYQIDLDPTKIDRLPAAFCSLVSMADFGYIWCLKTRNHARISEDFLTV